ncbi:pentapeptide repeat-containing protein [Streptomyces microflavus]|uniref:pentapeptide repeat-containing protein n=1 Tax=Streptomyces microflavus TaxID=1919 RepID=UPI003B20F91C
MSTQGKRILKTLSLTIVIAGYALLLWRGPWLLDGGHIRENNLQPADGVVITGVRTALVALGAGIVAAVGLQYTHRNHKLSQDQFHISQDQFAKQHSQTLHQFNLAQKQFEHAQEQFKATQQKDREQTEIAREGQVTGRYVEAIRLLGSDNITERLGGIYSLERIMNDSSRDYSTIVEVIAAFIRSAGSPGRQEWLDPATGPGVGVTIPSLAEDIQAAISVLGRRPERGTSTVVNLEVSEIASSRLFGVSLQRVNLRSARLRGIRLRNATLISADLTSADLRNADLSNARLRGARCRRVNLSGADLSSASAERANLIHANLRDTDLSGARLAGAHLAGADLSGANLFWADLESTNFTDGKPLLPRSKEESADYANLPEARGLTVGQLEHAYIYRSTKLPKDLADNPQIRRIIEECEARRENLRNESEQ